MCCTFHLLDDRSPRTQNRRKGSLNARHHDGLEIFRDRNRGVGHRGSSGCWVSSVPVRSRPRDKATGDRKSTRLNSSHVAISYAVFCLKKKSPISILSL